MATEVKALCEIDHAVLVLGVLLRVSTKVQELPDKPTYPFTKLLQDVDLNESLLMKPLLIPDDLDRDQAAGLVVNASYDLPETSLSKNINDFISITNDLVSVLGSAEEDIGVVHDLTPLIDIEHGNTNSFVSTDSFLRCRSLSKRVESSSGNICLLTPRAELGHLFLGRHIILIEVSRP
ncbi:hypothetical protein HG530_013560 [Fusarium avenaceum]|nr:hypothetical protein HG530_013560 [Fusarium avenaceum]